MKRTLLIGLALAGCTDDTAQPDPPPDDPAPEVCAPTAARIWKLTPDQYTNTVAAMIPGAGRPGDRLVASLSVAQGPFSNRAGALDMSQPHVDQLFDNAQALSAQALRDPGALFPCLATRLDDRACVRAFVSDFAGKGLRRPLADEEVERYLGLYDAQAPSSGPRGALAVVIQAVLLSPELLFRSELGAPGAGDRLEMTPYEKASALSYFLLDGPPDAELLEAARAGALSTPQQIAAQTRRLLSRPEAARGVDKFFTELLQLTDVPILKKTAAYFPAFNGKVAADLAEETRRFVRYVLWQDGGKLGTLLTASYSLLNKNLSDYYGAPGATGDDFVRVDFPPGQRAGLLTQGGLLSSLATEKETRPVARGKFVRERLLCQAIPPPPPNVNAVPPADNRKRTQRERLALHASDSTCATCHRLMDPIGLSLEAFDAAGAFRTVEYGKTLDLSGEIAGLGPPVPYVGAPGLGAALAGLPEANACFSRSLFEYAAGQAPQSCDAEAIAEAFSDSGGDVMDLMVRITTSPRFFVRQRAAKDKE